MTEAIEEPRFDTQDRATIAMIVAGMMRCDREKFVQTLLREHYHQRDRAPWMAIINAFIEDRESPDEAVSAFVMQLVAQHCEAILRNVEGHLPSLSITDLHKIACAAHEGASLSLNKGRP